MDAHLRGKNVLITGASGGIGLATARAFAQEECRLALHYNSNLAPLRELEEEINVPYVHLPADLRDEAQVDELFAAALRQFPRLDMLVVNAGIFVAEDAPLHKLSLKQWEETLRTNLTSAFLTCRAFLRHLAVVPRDDAAVVLVASTAALFGEAGHADYAAAKAGMAYGLMLSLKNEIVRLAARGRVNCVCPGWTRTPMAAHALDDERIVQRVQSTIALRKVAEPEDIAAAIVFLASPRLSGHISGAILPVSGGMEGRLLHPPE